MILKFSYVYHVKSSLAIFCLAHFTLNFLKCPPITEPLLPQKNYTVNCLSFVVLVAVSRWIA